MPFIRKPDHKISVEDIQYVLKSHYNETPYDPLGSGTLEQRRRLPFHRAFPHGTVAYSAGAQ